VTIALFGKLGTRPAVGLPPALHAAFALAAGKGAGERSAPSGGQRFASVSRGDAADAFEAFVRGHERELFGYLWRVTGDEHASYDLAQETFMRAWQRFDQVRGYDQPRAWLFRVATNLASNYRRARSVRVATALPLAGEADLAGDPAAAVALSDTVRAALDGMPVKQRSALLLRAVYGYSTSELARALDCSEAAAKMTLSRARERFRAHYRQEEAR
jgi:RNA polymerase sigma-70 factor, ECF subfamily